MKKNIIILSVILTILIVGGVILLTGDKNENRTSLKTKPDLSGAVVEMKPVSNMEPSAIRETAAETEEIAILPSPRSNYSRRLSEIEDNQKDAGYRIVRADEYGITIEIPIPDYRLDSIPRDDRSYQQVAIPGYFSLEEPGMPSVPAKIITLPLPGIETVEVTATSTGTVEAESVDLPISDSGDRIRKEMQDIWEKKITSDEQPLASLPPEWKTFAELQEKINSADREEPLKSDGSVPSGESNDSADDTYPAEIVSGASYWSGEEQALNILITPLQYNQASRRLSAHSHITVDIKFGKAVAALPKQAQPDYGDQFALADSDSFKAFVYQNGIHTITYQNLVDTGFNVGDDPRALRMYFMGQEIPIYIEGEDDGSWNPGDFIDFYGEKNTGFYSQTNVYWLYQTTGDGSRMVEVNSPHCGRPSRQLHFLKSLHLEKELWYRPYFPVEEGEDFWFWDAVGYTYGLDFKSNIEFMLSGVSDWEDTVFFTGRFFGYTTYDSYNPDHHTQVYLNGLLLRDWTWDGAVAYTLQTDIPQSAFNEGTNTITTQEVDDLGLPITGEFIFIDYFDLTYYRDYESVDDRLTFTASRKGDYRVNSFTGGNLALYDITDSTEPRRLTDFNIWTDSGNYLIFRKSESGERQYAALDRSAAFSPRLDQNTASDLPSPRVMDYIIITHPDFNAAIQPLASFREETAHGGFRVETFEVQDIYNTFSFGNFSPYGIKRFLEYAYTDWDSQTHPRYALLVGDGNYDYQNYTGTAPPNYLPPYMFHSEYMETCSDNWYACFIGDDKVPDMDLGRLCTTSFAETSDQAAKIIGYENGTDGLAWQNDILMVADNADPDAGDFPADSDWLIANYIPPSFTTDTAYIDGLGAAATRIAIINGFNTGRVLINYLGHGSIDSWSSPTIFSSATLTSLTNADRLPIMITPTCLNGYWCEVSQDCLAEAMTLAVGKGTIANVSPSGLSLNTPAKQMTGYIFTELLSNGYPFGTALTRAKAQLAGVTTYLYLLDIYTLFGDPAQPMK
ncbi:MAG: C25 family cysteine peptidase [Candidatus Auribacterota bacterium]|nr:C25 family cysteine peptidase [Candidatus Auribacterota bacterium]